MRAGTTRSFNCSLLLALGQPRSSCHVQRKSVCHTEVLLLSGVSSYRFLIRFKDSLDACRLLPEILTLMRMMNTHIAVAGKGHPQLGTISLNLCKNS